MNSGKQLIIDVVFNYVLWKFYDYTINEEASSFVVSTILFILPYFYQYCLWFCYESGKKMCFYLIPILYFISILLPLSANRLGLKKEILPQDFYVLDFIFENVTFKTVSLTIFGMVFLTFFIHFFIEKTKGNDSNGKNVI